MCEEKTKCPEAMAFSKPAEVARESKPAILLRSFFLEFNQQEYLRLSFACNRLAKRCNGLSRIWLNYYSL
jgi:hypothetical protein